MMALLYACTCPVVSKHLDLDYLDWKMPITNVVDLIHDYYLSQIAILLDREMVSGNDVVDSYLIIKRVLPQLGYELERKNTTVWGEDDFERALSNAVAETNAWIGGSCDVAVIRKIRRKFRIQSAEISEDKAYKSHSNRTMSFKSWLRKSFIFTSGFPRLSFRSLFVRLS